MIRLTRKHVGMMAEGREPPSDEFVRWHTIGMIVEVGRTVPDEGPACHWAQLDNGHVFYDSEIVRVWHPGREN